MMPSFDFEDKRLMKEISKQGAKRVLLQLPEGLKAEAPRLASIVELAGALPIISADPCYGACDLAISDAESVGADLIIHYGHSEMIEQERVPAVYIEAKAEINVESASKKALTVLKPWNIIGLTTTIQHVHVLPDVRQWVLEAGKAVVIGDAGSLKHAGQVIGCDYSNATSIAKDVEAFLFVGGGRFHAIGVALATGKPTIVADPYEERAYSLHEETQKILGRRWATILEAEKVREFGILLGLKIGQKRFDDAMIMKEKLEKSGRRATLLALKEVSPEALMQFPTMEAFVNTACPRLSLDDTKFLKPLLTPKETMVMLGEITWEDLCERGWFESEIWK